MRKPILKQMEIESTIDVDEANYTVLMDISPYLDNIYSSVKTQQRFPMLIQQRFPFTLLGESKLFRNGKEVAIGELTNRVFSRYLITVQFKDQDADRTNDSVVSINFVWADELRLESFSTTLEMTVAEIQDGATKASKNIEKAVA